MCEMCDLDLRQLAQIYGKLFKYLTNGLNMCELTSRFWEISKIFGKYLRYMRQG